MIYKYYCVNCGNQMSGEQITFDLSELIGIRDAGDGNSSANPAALIPARAIAAMAMNSGHPLRHNVISPITISLKDYLGLLGKNIGKLKEMQGYGFSDEDLRDAVEQIVKTNENIEAAGEKIDEYVARIKTLFTTDAEHQNSDNTKDYSRTFYVRPEFFEEGKSNEIYTIEYSHNATDPNTMKIRAPQPIRGYCPTCGKPIILHAGKYPHVLIGLLGAQSAGKTTMILAMMQELQKNFSELGIRFPGNVLCDGRYSITRSNQELFNNGWLPNKTNAAGANSFNASLLLETDDHVRKMLVTFADIAGEQCYDPSTNAMDESALSRFPLINSCDIYLLCTCLDRTQYVRMDDSEKESPNEKADRPEIGNEKIEMPPHAVLMIADGIYDNLRQSKREENRKPPLCIVMTKADVVKETMGEPARTNPFDAITPLNPYLYKSQLDNLSMTYLAYANQDVREPLEWCCKAYGQMKDKTYLSMMACSATGRVGETWKEKGNRVISLNPKGTFKSNGVKELISWIFQAIGLKRIGESNYRFFTVPSMDEVYYHSKRGELFRDSHYTDMGAPQRVISIPYVFMNPTRMDGEIFAASRKPLRQNPRGRSGAGDAESSVLGVIKKANRLRE